MLDELNPENIQNHLQTSKKDGEKWYIVLGLILQNALDLFAVLILNLTLNKP